MDMSELKHCIKEDDVIGIIKLLSTGLSPNHQEGLPLQLAARQGSINVAKTLVQWGAITNSPTAAGATPLQLAVYSNTHWKESHWDFLLENAKAEELLEAAAVAIVYKNMTAYEKIMDMGKCNMFTPTKLTGQTLEHLMRTSKIKHAVKKTVTTLSAAGIQDPRNIISKQLSPSVARFFQETSNTVNVSHSPILQGVHSPTPVNTQDKLSPMFSYMFSSPITPK